jgi:hypothetical protein
VRSYLVDRENAGIHVEEYGFFTSRIIESVAQAFKACDLPELKTTGFSH